nr:uncharacterized protein K02A2.6-like [Dermacentor andersoni]
MCGYPISVELDTEVSVSVMAGKVFRRTFPGVSVEASGVMQRSSNGQLSQVQGQAQELQWLRREGILVPVKRSEWTAPIVQVLKRDGSVGICRDFKVAINPVDTIEKYPLPRMEDLLSALSRQQNFSKLDLRDAYQQRVLHDASGKCHNIDNFGALLASF